MKKWMRGKLVCPDCLPRESLLELTVREAQDDDVMDGELSCVTCGRTYAIRRGIAVLLPTASMSMLEKETGYNSRQMLSAYLWSHFGDLMGDADATDAYQKWTSLFDGESGPALDIGCAVGRLSFELSQTHSHVIGIDTSISFIGKARELLKRQRLQFDLIIEGQLTEERNCVFDRQWRLDRVDFIVADAMALPFPAHLFSTTSSINILEKVADPLQHLTEVNRTLAAKNARFIFSDPFSWEESVSAPERWIGGKNDGRYSGRGFDCMHRLVKGEDGIFHPPMTILDDGRVSWKIRKTENLKEQITSQFMVGLR